MPQTVLQVFQDSRGRIPFQEWIDDLEDREPAAYAKCLATLLRLESFGYELRRPTADQLGNGIYELRFRVRNVQYRVLYFFHGQNAVVISHGFTKESKIPPQEIDTAVEHMKLVKKDPKKHMASWKVE